MISNYLNHFLNYSLGQDLMANDSAESLLHRETSRCWASSAAAARPDLASLCFPLVMIFDTLLICFLFHGGDLCNLFLSQSQLNFLISP